MAGPYHAAQSPESLPIASSRSSLLGLPFCTTSHRLTLVPIQSYTHSPGPKTAVLTGCNPAIKQTHVSVTIPFAQPPYITPPGAFSNQGRPLRAIFSSDPGECLRLPEIAIHHRTGSPQTALDLSVLHPLFQAAFTNRRSPPPFLSGSQPSI